MPSNVTVSFDDLESALYWVSSDSALENRAFISKSTGKIYYSSADGFVEEELPEDIDDDTQYWSVPHKNELELGRSLALKYVGEAMPDDFNSVQGFFHRRGAYSKFKSLLRRRGHLERWHEYENAATRQALQEWAAECGLRMVGQSGRSARGLEQVRPSKTGKESTMSNKQVAPETRGVAVQLLATVDLGPEIEGMAGRRLRMRMVTIEPGGVFGPIHDHKDRPGTVYILQGTITDHRNGVATDYGPGVGWPEDRNTTHWLENRGTIPAVEISVDIVRQEQARPDI